MLPKILQITEFTGMQISISYACFSCAPEKAPEFGAFSTLATALVYRCTDVQTYRHTGVQAYMRTGVQVLMCTCVHCTVVQWKETRTPTCPVFRP